MIRAPFIRLALLALCSLYVLGLVLVAEFVGIAEEAAVGLGGAVIAVALSFSIDPEKPRRRTTRVK